MPRVGSDLKSNDGVHDPIAMTVVFFYRSYGSRRQPFTRGKGYQSYGMNVSGANEEEDGVKCDDRERQWGSFFTSSERILHRLGFCISFLDRPSQIWVEFGSFCTEIGRNPGEKEISKELGRVRYVAESLGMDTADTSQAGDDGSSGSGYAINGEIMMAAIAVLFTVILFIVCLHVYAKWFWRQSSRVIIYRRRGRRRGSWSLRRFAFVGAEDGGHGEDRDNVGLDKAVIESMPVFVYQSGRYEEGLDCAVCLCEFEDNEKGRLLPTCKHSFHVDCIEMWLLSHSTCPLCRTRVQADQGFLSPPANVAEEFGGGDDVLAAQAAVDSNCEEIGENSGSPQQEEGEPSSESAKISVNRLRSLKKLLGRENRVFPSDPDVGDIEQGGQPLPQQ